MSTPSVPAASERASKRPEIRNIALSQLAAYRLPPPGVVSILHRASGALLFLLLPLLLWLFDLSLTSEGTFERARELVHGLPVRIVVAALAVGFVHHALAGIRFLLIDLHVGVDKPSARRGAVLVLALDVVCGLLAVLAIFGVF